MPQLDKTRIAIICAIGGASILLAFLLLSPAPTPIAPPIQAPAAVPAPSLVPID